MLHEAKAVPKVEGTDTVVFKSISLARKWQLCLRMYSKYVGEGKKVGRYPIGGEPSRVKDFEMADGAENRIRLGVTRVERCETTS